jgi:putative transcriptional regulator
MPSCAIGVPFGYVDQSHDFSHDAELHTAKPTTFEAGILMNKFSKNLIKSLGEATDHAKGRASSARVHVIKVPDVRTIRRKLHISQPEFAQKYRIPLATLRNWEQGRRQPDEPAAASSTRSLCVPAKLAKLLSCNELELA